MLHFQNQHVSSLHRPSHPRIFVLMDFHLVDISLPVVHMVPQNLFLRRKCQSIFGLFRSIFVLFFVLLRMRPFYPNNFHS